MRRYSSVEVKDININTIEFLIILMNSLKKNQTATVTEYAFNEALMKFVMKFDG